MKTKEQLNEQIETFLNKLDFPFCLGNHIIVEEIELEDPFNSILNQLEYNNVFKKEGEIIDYYSALDYLKENDPSLEESLNLAAIYAYEFGHSVTDLTSEILATLLKAEKYRVQFYGLEDEIKEFFNDIEEDILSVSE